MSGFTRATKRQARARIALTGPSGSGKTFTALSVAHGLGDRVAVLDTEHGSASLYADLFDFDVVELPDFAPATYIKWMLAAEADGYDVIVVDSLSHAWSGRGGVLEIVDRATTGGNTFGSGWKVGSPEQNKLVAALLAVRAHLICTMRVKTAYEVTRDDRGKTKVEKVGTTPVQRDGIDYEFGVVGDLDLSNTLTVTKTRCPDLRGAVIEKPGADLGKMIRRWLDDGAPTDEAPRIALDDAVARADAATSLDELRQLSREVEHLLDIDVQITDDERMPLRQYLTTTWRQLQQRRVPADIGWHDGEIRKAEVVDTPAASPADPIDITAPENHDALRAEVAGKVTADHPKGPDPVGDRFYDTQPEGMVRDDQLARAFMAKVIGELSDATSEAGVKKAWRDVDRQHKNGVISDADLAELAKARDAQLSLARAAQ